MPAVTGTVPAVTAVAGLPSLSRRARGQGLNPSLRWCRSLSNQVAFATGGSTRHASAALSCPAATLRYPLRRARRVSRAAEATRPIGSSEPMQNLYLCFYE